MQYIRFEVYTSVTMQNIFFWGVAPCGSRVSEERIASIFRRGGEHGITVKHVL
jgi:hypothetical protein